MNSRHMGKFFQTGKRRPGLLGLFVVFIFYLTLSGQAQAAIAYVKQNGTATASSGFPVNSVTVNITSAPVVGNTVIVFVATDYSSLGTPGCSDNGGNTYNVDVQQLNSSAPNYAFVMVCSAQISTAPTTITVTHHNAYSRAVIVHEFSGLAAAPAWDRTSSGGGNSTTPSSGATAVTSQANELVVGAVAAGGPSTDGFTADASFPGGPFRLGQNGANPRTINAQYKIVSSTAAYTYAPTLGTSRPWSDGIVTYKAAAASTTCTVTNTNDSGAGSLRQCIITANGTPGTTIAFNIPGPGNQSAGADSWWQITPSTALPKISAANTVIDGTTQTTNRGNTNSLGPEIEINGATVGAGGWDGFGIITPASGVTIKGFIINRWSGAGISLDTGSGSNTVTGNYIGTNYAGTAALGSMPYGIFVTTDGNTIGGTTAAARNVISGNAGLGIHIASNNNSIQGNYIGVNATASGVLANTTNGIQMVFSANNNIIGGTVAGAGNVISGNTGEGIYQNTSGTNTVQGNYIGTNASSASLPNSGNGIYISAGTINLGNASEAQSNVIGPNTGFGINLAGGTINLAGTVTVNDDVTLSTGTLSMGGATLNVSGNWTHTTATITPGTSTVVLNGATNQTITTGGASFFNLTLNNSGGAGSNKAIISDALTTTGALSLTNGALDIGTNNPAVNTAGNVTIAIGGSVGVTARTANWTFNGTSILTDSSTGGPQQLNDVVVNGTSLTLGSSAKMKTLAVTAGTMNLGASGYILELTGTGTPLSNSGTFSAGTSTVKYTGTTTATNITTVPYSSLWLAPTAATTYSLTGNLTAGNAMTGNLTVDANATLDGTATNYNLTAANITINNGGTYLGRASTITAGGTWTNNGTYTAGTSTVSMFPSASNFFFYPGASTYYNVVFDSRDYFLNLGGSFTASGDVTVKTTGSGFGTLNMSNFNITAANYFWQSGYISAGTGVVSVSENWSMTGGGYFSGATNIAFTGGGNSTFTPGSGTHGNVTVNKSTQSAVVNLATNNLTMAASKALTITSGIFDIAGRNLNIGAGSTFSNDGTLRLQGGETITNLSNDTNSGTVEYNGNVSYASLSAGNSYYHLTFSDIGSWTHTGALDVNGNLTITSGTLISGGQNVNVAGNWSNTGTYTSGANTVTLDGTGQSVSGNTTFNNFTKSVATAQTLTFAAGSTTTINGLATINGASGQLLSLRSSTNGTRWNIRFAGTKSISFVDVRDSDASGSAAANKPVSPASSTDSGNNISWFQAAISGVVYIDQGVTNIGSGKTVRLIVNGSSAGTATTDVSGAYSINASFTAGDALLAYIDNDATYKGNTVTMASGATLAGLDIYASHLITRQDNGGSLSNANLSTAKGSYSDASDILYSVTSNNLTVSGSSWTLYIPTGQSYTPGGNITTPNMTSVGTFNGGSGSVTVNGAFILSGGVFTSTNGTMTISPSSSSNMTFFTYSAGAFNHNSGTLSLNPTNSSCSGSITFTASLAVSLTVKNLITNGVVGCSGIPTTSVTGNTVTALGNFTHTDGQIDGNFAVQGNLIVGAGADGGAATITMNGNGAQTYAYSAGGKTAKLVVDTTGTVSPAGGTTALSSRTLNLVNGTFTAPSGTLTVGNVGANETGFSTAPGTTFNNSNGTVSFTELSSCNAYTMTVSLAAGHTLYNAIINGVDGGCNGNYGTVTTSSTVIVTNDLQHASGYASGTWEVRGNLTIGASAKASSGTIAMKGNGAQTYSYSAGGATGKLTIDTTGTVSPAGGTTALASRTINLVNGTFTAPSGTFTLGNVNATETSFATAVGTTFNHNNGLVAFIQPSNCIAHVMTVSLAAGHNFYDVTFNGLNGFCNGNWGAITSSGTIIVANNFQHTSGILNGTWEIRGNLTVGASAQGGSATISFTGSNNQSYTNSGGNEPDGSYTVNKISGTMTLATAMNLNAASQALTVTTGTLDLAGNALTVTSALTVGASGTLQLQGGESVTTGSKVFNADSTVIYNGGGTYASLVLGNSYSNLTFNNATGSWTHSGTLTAKDLTLIAGSLISGGQNINISGNWSNSGTYTSGANTVTFNGAGQSITGNTTFNHFTKTVVAADTLTFAAGSTQTFNGTVTLNGASGQLLSLVSATPGTRWNFLVNASATKAISYVRVTDSDASASAAAQKPIGPINSTDSGNNIAWFSIPTVVKSMTVISDPLNNITNPKAIPGAVIEYTITIANGAGGSTATNIVVTDNLNADIAAGRLVFNPNTYAAGQGIQVTAPNINGGAAKNLTNGGDADEGDFNVTGTNTATVSGIALTAGQSATVKFRVTVQ